MAAKQKTHARCWNGPFDGGMASFIQPPEGYPGFIVIRGANVPDWLTPAAGGKGGEKGSPDVKAMYRLSERGLEYCPPEVAGT